MRSDGPPHRPDCWQDAAGRKARRVRLRQRAKDRSTPVAPSPNAILSCRSRSGPVGCNHRSSAPEFSPTCKSSLFAQIFKAMPNRRAPIREGGLLPFSFPVPRLATSSRVMPPSCCSHWHWSPYSAYPGFESHSGAIAEYNAKFMCGQYVLRGGSCASHSDHIRSTYRNCFPPETRFQFSGIRMARRLIDNRVASYCHRFSCTWPRGKKHFLGTNRPSNTVT